MSVLKIKEWKQSKEHQFRMSNGQAIRLKDKVQFNRDYNNMGKIWLKYQKGCILEFMADYIHVQIEIFKQDVITYNDKKIEVPVSEVLEVPINDIRRRA